MLEAMYTNPSIRFYPRSLTVKCCANSIDDLHEIDWDHERAQTATARKSWMNNLDSIFSMISPLEAECFGHWHTPEVSHVSSDNDTDGGSDDGDFEAFEDIYHRVSIGALLTLLPNLEVSLLFQRLQSYLIADLVSCEQIIILTGYTEQFEQDSHGNLLDQIVRWIARSHLSLDIVTSKPLSRLREIRLEDRRLEYEGDGDESENFRTFASFVGPKSL